ncbi:unnamed protein product [Rotaria sordida]|uniref:Uncharacterized protein n=1 Tax=Rotaria sordida TaxID=392033 RepID=A0A815TJD6_9BILA|nr:unnamed protein product [Rotaria sordida]
MQMIRTEKDICAEKELNQMNIQLIMKFEKVKYEHEQQICEAALYQDRKMLTIIYEKMKIIRSYPEIHEPMLTIEQEQKAIMKQHEVVI